MHDSTLRFTLRSTRTASALAVLAVSFVTMASSHLAAQEGDEPTVPEHSGSFRIAEGAAAPGDTVRLDFAIRSDLGTQGFSFSLDFDEEVLEAVGVEPTFEVPGAQNWGYQRFQFDNSNATAGNAGVDEGYVVGIGVFMCIGDGTPGCTFWPIALEPDTDVSVLDLVFRVREAAPVGVTELSFIDGGVLIGSSGTRFPTVNNITGQGISIDGPSVEIAPIFVTGRLSIVGDQSFFRGDANRDGRLNVSDPVRTLDALFLGGRTLGCADAADANDDGVLDLSDPVYLLNFLFVVGPAPLPPFPQEGSDPTEDGLRCFDLSH